jgi:hypothetical protein
MVSMPETHFSARDWMAAYESAKRELADICFAEQRCASYAEMSQLEWLRESGHCLWQKDKDYPRCSLNAYIAGLESDIKKLSKSRNKENDNQNSKQA